MTVGFAQFVAGKAAMFANDPTTARKYLSALISSGDYKLVDTEDKPYIIPFICENNQEKFYLDKVL